jgi:hypothetical protein
MVAFGIIMGWKIIIPYALLGCAMLVPAVLTDIFYPMKMDNVRPN